MDNFEKQQIIETIKTVIKARLIFVLLALGQVMVLKMLVRSISLTSGLVAIFIVAVLYAVNLFFWLYIRRPPAKISSWGLGAVKNMQVVSDALFVGVMIYFNGTVNTISSAFLLLVVMVASALYRKKGIVLATLMVLALFNGLALLEYFGLLVVRPNPELLAKVSIRGDWFGLARQVIVFNFYLAGASVFAGFLASLYRRRERRLEHQKDELVEKTEALQRQTKELTVTKNHLWIERNKLEAIIRNLSDGLIMLDPRAKIAIVNEQAEQTMGLRSQEILGRSLWETSLRPLVDLDNLIKSEAGPLSKKELPLATTPETILEVTTIAVTDLAGEKLGQLIVMHDVTREKAIEEMKSEFVTIAAHQLRTPLSGVKWALSLLSTQGKLTPEQMELVQRSYGSNERMINLINDLLNISRIEEGRFLNKLTDVCFEDLIEEVLAELTDFIKIKKVRVNFEKPPGSVSAMVDRDKMKLVVFNLIENAVSYSPADSEVAVRLAREDGALTVMVKDQGMGIPSKEQPRIFSRFFRGKSALKKETDGTGLGLYIAKNIVTSHGGNIWFESEENKGTTFYFKMPLKREGIK